jgi:prepilin-type N-terminal cleavage/methylation domain-containing protein
MKRRNGKTGFTLLELLVVLGILAAIMAMLVPTITKSLELVYKYKTRSIIKDTQNGLAAFRNAFGAYPPSLPRHAGGERTGVMDSGAANLVYYLRGPGGGGWGMGNGGTMPFGGRPRKTWPPFIRPDASMLVYDDDEDLAGMLDAWPDAGIVRGKLQGRIVYFQARPREEGSPFYANDNELDPSDAVEGYANQEHLEISCGVGPLGSVGLSYLLVSPGADRRYGYVREIEVSGETQWVPATADDEDKRCDDIIVRE